MAKNNRKKRKLYYIALNKSNNSIVIRVTKRAIGDFLGISVDTIRRRLDHKLSYHCDEYSIWCNISIPILKRGFYIKPIAKYQSYM
jgi:hypothetical protein